MQRKAIEENLIVNLTFNFAVLITNYCEQLEGQRKYNISNQLFRSGTSIGANVWEAQNAESKADFIHKFKIAAKEMEETNFWLLLCKNINSLPNPEIVLEELKNIQRVITKIISTAKRN